MLAYYFFSIFLEWIIPYFLVYHSNYLNTDKSVFIILPRQLGPSWDGGWDFIPKPSMPPHDEAMAVFKKLKPTRKPGDFIVSFQFTGENIASRLIHPKLGPFKIWNRLYTGKIDGPDGPANFGFGRNIYVKDK